VRPEGEVADCSASLKDCVHHLLGTKASAGAEEAGGTVRAARGG
jgi:hypothetical protein